MPWKHQWVEPEIAFLCTTQDKGRPSTITVYHAYKENDYYERLCWWYTLHDGDPASHPPHISGTDHTVFEFDIRTFPTYDKTLDHRTIFQQAVDQKLCTIEDVFIYIQKAHNVSHDH